MDIVISIPAYNEEKTLGNVLKDIKKSISKYSFRILVVDDGSTDKTKEIAKKEGAIVISHPRNCGLAETFKTEMRECVKLKPHVIVHTDADGQYRASDIPKLVREIENGFDLVLGSRFTGQIEDMPFLKKLGNLAFSKVVSSITHETISDAQTGFRAFTKEVAELNITSNHTYTQEQIIRASKAKFKIKEVPIYFAKRGGGTKSRLMKNPFEYAIKAWINLFRIYRDYEPLKFFGYIGFFFMALGLIVGLIVVHSIYATGSAGGIPRVILSALSFTTGLQILLFGFLADMNRK